MFSVLFLLFLYNLSLSLFFSCGHLDYTFLSSGSLLSFFLEISRTTYEEEKCNSISANSPPLELKYECVVVVAKASNELRHSARRHGLLASFGKLVFPLLARCLSGRRDMRCHRHGSPNLTNPCKACSETHFSLEGRNGEGWLTHVSRSVGFPEMCLTESV